ncbi:location of vulva defective 1-like isoform X1 [Daphnia pulicaria]|uniref:location of vulva defective 1-like isoform X1 n=1 Tax=Daphnia pulicaria TaxID=35523 RepID=UPI001EEC9A86|nr:location of vulva defective 1-like isoform X1 [Daphnia pulicaria]
MKLFDVLIVVAIFITAGCLAAAAQDVTGSEPPPSEATPVTEENNSSAGTETASIQTPGEPDDVQDASTVANPPADGQGTNSTTPSIPPGPVTEGSTTNRQPEPTEVVSHPTVRETTTILPETTTTTTTTSSTAIPTTSSSTTISSTTTQLMSTSSVAGPIPVADQSTAGNSNDSTSSSTVSTTETVTTRRPTRTARTTTQRRSTTTTSPYHECVTSSTCLDPNAHCVNLGGTNTCECRTGFRKSSPNGSCLLIELPTTTTTTSPLENVTEASSTTQHLNVTTSPVQSSSTEPPTAPVHQKRDVVRQASDLSQVEKMDVVTIGLQPATSVVEWVLEQDLTFRTAIARILTSTNYSILEESETTKTINVTADQVLYVAPSPQMTAEGLLVSFLVLDKENVTPRHHSFISSIIARHKREINSTGDSSTGYLPAIWITTAIHSSQLYLETSLNQTVSSLYGGVIPYQLLSLEQLAAASLFERRLDIFIPLILVAALGFMALAVSLVCIRAKTRSTATWDPPAGVVFGKTSIKRENREDPLGSTSNADSTGQHLATDEQCRDGEEELVKNSSRINADDDVWVVPYEDGPPQGQPGHLKTQYEDTKL